ncbi:MAG TPA: hypothetical protein VGD43_02995 [Micromonospora sp.]
MSQPDSPPNAFDAAIPNLDAYLVILDRGGIGYAGPDRGYAHKYASHTGGLVVKLPVVGDYRTTRANADEEQP